MMQDLYRKNYNSSTDQAQSLRNKVLGIKEPKINIEKEEQCTRIITVTSGKGGVGKTNFTVNFALTLAKRGLRVLIIDADFGLSNVDVILGISPEYNLSHCISNEMDIVDVIATGPYGIKFISGGSGVYDLINLSQPKLKSFVKNLMKLEDLADVIIFDTGAGISDNILHLITSSTDVFMVTTPEPTSLMDAYAVIKTIANRGITDLNIKLIVNRVESIKEGLRTGENFRNVVRNYLKLEVEPIGHVLSDDLVVKSIKQQVPFVINYPNSSAANNIYKIVDNYLCVFDSPQKTGGIRSFLQRFINKLAQ